MGWKKFIPKPIRSAVTSVVTNVFNINPLICGFKDKRRWIMEEHMKVRLEKLQKIEGRFNNRIISKPITDSNIF